MLRLVQRKDRLQEHAFRLSAGPLCNFGDADVAADSLPPSLSRESAALTSAGGCSGIRGRRLPQNHGSLLSAQLFAAGRVLTLEEGFSI